MLASKNGQSKDWLSHLHKLVPFLKCITIQSYHLLTKLLSVMLSGREKKSLFFKWRGLFLFLFSCVHYVLANLTLSICPLRMGTLRNKWVSKPLQFSYSQLSSILGQSVWETKNTKVHLKKFNYSLGLTLQPFKTS